MDAENNAQSINEQEAEETKHALEEAKKTKEERTGVGIGRGAPVQQPTLTTTPNRAVCVRLARPQARSAPAFAGGPGSAAPVHAPSLLRSVV